MPDRNGKAETHSGKAEYEKLASELDEAVSARMRAEEALQESESKYRSLTEICTDIIITVDTEGIFTYISPAVEIVTGYPWEHFIGRSFIEMIVPEYIESTVDRFKRGLAGEDIPLYEIEILHKDGRAIPVELNSSSLIDHQGKVAGRMVVGRDITERKNAEKALRESEQSLTNVFESVHDGISILKPDLTIVHVNGIMNEWYKENLPLEGKKCYEVYQNADKACEPCPTLRCLESGSIECNVVPGLPDSPIEWIELFSYPIKDPNTGKLTGVVEFVRDITERKKAEAALSKANNIISRSPAVAFQWRMDECWSVEFVSENVEQLTGYSSQEFLESKVCYKEIIHIDDLERVVEEVKKHSIIEGLQTYAHKPYRIINKKGETKWIDDRTYIYRDSRGVITHYEGIVSDITEQIKLEAQLRQALKMESVGRLAGGVAHDFNNMLSVILGHTEMALAKMNPDQTLYAHLIEIRKAAERSADLTRQLLAFARKQTIAPKLLDLNETLYGMLKMLRRLIGEDIELTFLPGADLWPIKMDPVQIHQILANLCVNAQDAIEGVGRVTIETGYVTLDKTYCANHLGFIPGEYVQLIVSDDGCGMDKQIMSNLFEPFFTTKDIGKGTGLGLATVYGIVKQNGGFIYVYSEPDQGTSFKIYLPRHAIKSAAMQKDNLSESTPRGQETILLVEDETSILQLITIMLEYQGYTVMAASTPGEAIRLAEAHPGEINLLMTDVVMPEMNGGVLARNLISFYPNLKRLFMSGYTANVIAHHGVLDEGVHFIQKPFRNQDLAAKVREALDSE